MNKFIAEAMRASSHHELEEISLEGEIHATLEAEDVRWRMVSELADAHRSIDICEALEGLAFVAAEVKEPTPQQAALISIGGDMAVAGTDMTGDEITPSLEDFNVALTGDKGHTVGTAEKVRAAIDQVLKVLRELLARVVASVRAYVRHVRDTVGGAQARQKKIKERLASLSRATAERTGEFTMTLPTADGKEITSLNDLVKEGVRFAVMLDSFLHEANEFNVRYATGLVALYEQLGEKSSVVESFTKLEGIVSSTNKAVTRAGTEEKTLPDQDFIQCKRFTSPTFIGGLKIVSTKAMLVHNVEDHSSAALRQALNELTTNVGIKVTTSDGTFSGAAVTVKPLSGNDMKNAVQLVDELIEHYTGKSEHTSLAAAAERRSEFAETSVEHIAKHIAKFGKDDVGAKEFAMAAQRVGTSIMENATSPYTAMTSATGRVISILQSAIMKSISARESEESSPGKAQPSNESISDELVYSTEGLFGDLIGGIKKALGLRKPTKLNLQKIQSGYHDLKELRAKIEKNYIQTKHEVKTGEVGASNIVPYLFAAKSAEDPSHLPSEWSSALQSAHGAMTTLADMMAKSGMEAYAIFKKYHDIEKSVENFKKMEAEFVQFLNKWKAPAKPNLSGVLKNFQLDDLSLLGKNPNLVSWDERSTWRMGELRPSIKAAAENAKLPVLSAEQIPSVGKAMIEAIDFLINHQLQAIIKDTNETLMNIEYGHEIVVYEYDWKEEQLEKKTLTEHDMVHSRQVESAGDQYTFLYFSMLIEYFAAITEMILAGDRWVSASIKD